MSDGTISVIYGLVDCVGTIRYVGHTRNPRARLRQHMRRRHWCCGLVVLEEVSHTTVREAECRHIAIWGEWNDLENRNRGGAGTMTHSPETRAKMSASRKGRVIISQEQRAKLSAALKGNRHFAGKTHKPETRAQISAALMGHPVSAETRARMSAANKGRIIAPEARANMAAALRGHVVSAETRAKISAAHKGRTPTPEARANMSAGQRRRFARKAA